MSDFTLDIERFVKKTKLDLRTVIRKIVLDVFVRIIVKTPVDTGRARGNWQTSLGFPITQQISRRVHGKGDAVAPAGEAASVVGKFLASGKDGDVYLSNNVPYIMFLEYGSSIQAPAGMVRITLAEYQRFVDEAVNKL